MESMAPSKILFCAWAKGIVEERHSYILEHVLVAAPHCMARYNVISRYPVPHSISSCFASYRETPSLALTSTPISSFLYSLPVLSALPTRLFIQSTPTRMQPLPSSPNPTRSIDPTPIPSSLFHLVDKIHTEKLQNQTPQHEIRKRPLMTVCKLLRVRRVCLHS